MVSIYTTVLYVQPAILNALRKHKLLVGFREADIHKGTLGTDVNIAMQFLSRGGRPFTKLA